MHAYPLYQIVHVVDAVTGLREALKGNCVLAMKHGASQKLDYEW